MSEAASSRESTPISDEELGRRWGAIKARMEAEAIDVLVAYGASETSTAYAKYLTDVAVQAGTPLTVVLPRDDAMTVISHGPLDGDSTRSGPYGEFRGAGRVLTAAFFPSVAYTVAEEARLTVKALRPYAQATIALAAPHQMPSVTVDALRRELPSATFVQAAQMIDEIKAVKSDEELELIRRTARLQDDVMEQVFGRVVPGMREAEIAALAQHLAHDGGSNAGVFLCGSSPPGEPAMFALPHTQTRRVQEGDNLSLLLECDGPGGQFAHLGRVAVLGRASDRQLEEFEFARRAQSFTLEQIRPGATPSAIWDAYNAFMRDNDRPAERRLHCHGQGYDLVEPPLIRNDETMSIAARLNVGCHPMYAKDGDLHYVCDNYFLGADGAIERLHAYPQVVVEL